MKKKTDRKLKPGEKWLEIPEMQPVTFPQAVRVQEETAPLEYED